MGQRSNLSFFLFTLFTLLLSQTVLADDDDNHIATLFGNALYLSDVKPDDATLREMEKEMGDGFRAALGEVMLANLTNKIINAVLSDYAQTQNMVIDSALTERFKRTFAGTLSDKSAQEIVQIAEKNVLQWQAEKAMFETFGGRVIFQQTNPLTPIDAYKALLTQYKEKGSFIILDPDARARFWETFEPPFRFEVASENVDFRNPWWAK